MTPWRYFTQVRCVKNFRESPGGEEGGAGGQHRFPWRLTGTSNRGGGASPWLYLPDYQGFHEEIQFVLFRTHFRQRLGTEGEGGKVEKVVSRSGERLSAKS